MVSWLWPDRQFWELWTAFPRDPPWSRRGTFSQRFLYIHWSVGLEYQLLLFLFNDECLGSRVRAFGTCLVSDICLWECFIDNISIGAKPHSDLINPENNWILCDSDSLADGTHNFTLQATIYPDGNFWFDQVQYVPSVGLSLDSSLILVNASDSAIQYTTGWQDVGRIFSWNMSYYTTLPNRQADMAFDFNGPYLVLIGNKLSLYTRVHTIGTSLKWFSLTLNDTSLTSQSISASSYTVDEADPVNFGLEPTAAGLIRYNRLIFEVSNLTPGRHRLSVSHIAGNQTNPLTLNYLIIQNSPALVGSTPTPTSVSSSPLSSSSSANPGGFTPSGSATDNHKGSSTGAIVGGTMGGVVVIVAVVLLLLLRRRNNRKDADQELNREETSPNIVEPFNTPPTAPVSFQKSHSGGQQSSSSAVATGLTRHIPHYPSKFCMIPTGPRLLTPHNLSNESSGSPENHISTPGNARPQEADELRELSSTDLLSVPPEIPVTSNSYSPSDTAAPQRVMRHEDSGVRLPAQESTLESPPLYTVL